MVSSRGIQRTRGRNWIMMSEPQRGQARQGQRMLVDFSKDLDGQSVKTSKSWGEGEQLRTS